MAGKKSIIMDEINDAVARGDYIGAAALEKERNQKIASEGLPYEQTNNYGKYLDGTDYGDRGMSLIRQGASGEAVGTELAKRRQKTNVPGYSQYQNDAVDATLGKYVDLHTTVNQPFTYENGSAQLSARQKELDALYNGLRNYKKFEYNPETDPLYQALSEQYTRNGRRAMDDTTAKVSARTGGLASSYAATAGNQAYGNYMAELSDRIPELTQLAYQMYNDEYNRKLSEAQIAQNRYDSELARYQADRNFAYGKFADDRNMAYSQLRDMVEGERYRDETDYNRDFAQKQWDYNKEQDRKQWDYQLGRDAIADKRYEDETAYNRRLDALKLAKSGSSGGSGSGKISAAKPKLTYAQMSEAVANGDITPGVEEAYLYYHGKPYGALNIDGFSDDELMDLAELGAFVGDENGNLFWANGWDDESWEEKRVRAKVKNTPKLSWLQGLKN